MQTSNKTIREKTNKNKNKKKLPLIVNFSVHSWFVFRPSQFEFVTLAEEERRTEKKKKKKHIIFCMKMLFFVFIELTSNPFVYLKKILK